MSFNRALKDAGLSIRVNSTGGRTVGSNAAMDRHREENTRFPSERRGKTVRLFLKLWSNSIISVFDFLQNFPRHYIYIWSAGFTC